MSSVFVGCCNGLKNYIFNHGALSHPELYWKSKDSQSNYIRLEYKEGGAVAESILDGALAYPPKPSNPPARVLRTNKEKEVARYVNAKANVDKGLKQAYTLMWGQCTEMLQDKLETGPR